MSGPAEARAGFLRVLAAQIGAAAYRMALPDGRYEYMSPGIEALTGHGPEEFYANPLLIRELIDPAWGDQFERAWSALLAGEMPETYTYPIVHRSGEVRWLHQQNGLQRDAEGNPVAIEGVITDVTLLIRAEEECARLVEQRTAELEATNRRLSAVIADHEQTLETLRDRESRLQLLLDNIPAAISYVDSEQRYRINNRTYEEWFGETREALYGKTMREVLGEAAYGGIEGKVREALSGRPVTFEGRVPYERGGTRYVRASYIPHRDAANQGVNGFYVLVSDISESKRWEASERQHLRELAHAERLSAAGEMANSILHELSQPLVAIDNYSAACVDFLEQGRHRELHRTACQLREQSSRIFEIIRGLRQFARNSELDRVPVDLGAMVREILGLLQYEIHAREMTVEAECDPDMPGVDAVSVLIEQVVLNLLHNAMDSTAERGAPHGPISVRVAGSDTGVQVTVRDQGCGIDPEIEHEVFESFVTTKKKGMGLGLAICRRIIESHGGTLWGENNPDAPGATFGFRLPAGARSD